MRNQSEPSNFAAIKPPILQEALDQLFYEARTHSTWLPEPVPVELNLICNLGYGDPNKLHPRNPRLNFEEAAVIL